MFNLLARAPVGVRPRLPERVDRNALGIRSHARQSPGRARVERPRPVIHPDVVVGVDGNTADLADPPVVGQRLRPAGIDDEARRGGAFGHARSPSSLRESFYCSGCAERRRVGGLSLTKFLWTYERSFDRIFGVCYS